LGFIEIYPKSLCCFVFCIEYQLFVLPEKFGFYRLHPQSHRMPNVTVVTSFPSVSSQSDNIFFNVFKCNKLWPVFPHLRNCLQNADSCYNSASLRNFLQNLLKIRNFEPFCGIFVFCPIFTQFGGFLVNSEVRVFWGIFGYSRLSDTKLSKFWSERQKRKKEVLAFKNW